MKSDDLDAMRNFQQPVVVKEHLSWIKQILGTETPETHKEENAKVLSRMVADGDMLTDHRDVEFNHLFNRENSAIDFLQAALDQGYTRSEYLFWDDHLCWLTSIRVTMIPNLEEITATELQLMELASSFHGKPDGWGCIEVIKPESA